jgi:membrane protease YdiL (CAAX protease family)
VRTWTDRAATLLTRTAARRPLPLAHIVGRRVIETDTVIRRRQAVVLATSVVGTGLLGRSLSTPPGSRSFYTTTAAVAAVWGLGGVASGPLHLGWIEGHDATIRRPVLTPIATGAAAFGVFYGAALVARRIPPLNRALRAVLSYARHGESRLVYPITLANGLGEEIFFRGAVYSAFPNRHPVIASTTSYAVATTATRNPALVIAAGVMGTLFGLQRRASGGIQAPVLTHTVWSTLMLRFLPPLFEE